MYRRQGAGAVGRGGRGGAVEEGADPETEEEKVDGGREHMEEHLRPKGEFLILRNLCEDLDVPPSVVQTAIEELLAVADAGLVMPPKSTWFEPKLRSGLFVHLLD